MDPRNGRVIAVFGSAGLRDREKRGMMGHVAGKLADLTIVTAEDPRTERVEDISAEIARALEAEGRVEGRDFWQVHDRAEAIAFAIGLAQPGDMVITCGKAHEILDVLRHRRDPLGRVRGGQGRVGEARSVMSTSQQLRQPRTQGCRVPAGRRKGKDR